jgi:glycosyltransferase involved in cell wall biosynthesis
MNDRTVSVVIPAYNNPEYTKKTLNSIYSQSHRPIEIILSDDCSPNSLEGIIDPSVIKNSLGVEYKYFRQKVNLHYYSNLQFALKQATGKYVVLVDHDDRLLDNDYFVDSILAIENNKDCYLSIANSFVENKPITTMSLCFDAWHYVSGTWFMERHLFYDVHPSRSAVMLDMHKLRELKYEDYFLSKEEVKTLNIMPDESLILICLLASLGSIAITGRIVSLRGEPLDSLSKSSVWRNLGQGMFVHYSLLFKYFQKIGCHAGMRTMVANIVTRYPCEKFNYQIIKYLQYDKSLILLMLVSILKYNLRRVKTSPRILINKAKSIIKKMLLGY